MPLGEPKLIGKGIELSQNQLYLHRKDQEKTKLKIRDEIGSKNCFALSIEFNTN